MHINQCRLCHETRPLRRSHVIPDAIFRRVLRENQGKAITFSDENLSWIEYSSDSWWEHLLCEECEDCLDQNYEKYSISVLRNKLKSVTVSKAKGGVSFSSVDAVKLQLFIVSMMWRAAVSSLPVYSKVYLPPMLENEIRSCLLRHQKVRPSLISIRISRLSDKTPNGFSLDTLRSLIISPFFRNNGKNFSFCFLIEGFFLEIFVPSLKLRERSRPEVIKVSQRTVFANYLNIFDVPELAKLMVAGYGNYVEGRSKIERKQDHVG